MVDALSQAELYVHRHRPEWGLAICTESRQNKTEFLFQDGTTRTFRDDFLHLMTPADRPADVTERVVNRLRMQANGTVSVPSAAPNAAADVPKLKAQIQLFKHLFPGGFEDPDFIAKHRGAEGMRRRKAHHGVASAEAQEKLNPAAIEAALAAGDQDGIVETLCTVLEQTSLAPKAVVGQLRTRAAATGVIEQLHSTMYNDEVTEFDRFTRWLMVLEGALGQAAGWEIATAVPALLDPEQHVPVKRAPFQRIARRLASGLTLNKTPNAELYRRVRDMSLELKSTLEANGLAPRDLLDIASYVALVMRPKHIELLDSLED